MSRDKLRRFVPGQSFVANADQLNAWNDAAEDHLRQQAETDELFGTFVPPRIRNETGGVVDRFGILGIRDVANESVVVTPDDNEREFFSRPVFRGEAPDSDKHTAGQIAVGATRGERQPGCGVCRQRHDRCPGQCSGR